MENKLTVNKVIKALEKTGGTIYPAAQNLNVDRRTVYNYVNKYPEVKKALDEIRESLLDLAEAKLFENIKSNKEGSIFYYLNNQGKQRGYNRPQDIKLSGSVSILSDLSDKEVEKRIDDIDEQLAKINAIRGK